MKPPSRHTQQQEQLDELFGKQKKGEKRPFKVYRGPSQTYSWDDQVYRDFMIGVLSHLEPRFDKRGVFIYKALQETEQLFFIMDGAIDIGFELNNKIKYCLRLQNGNVVGAFNCTFNKKTLYTYRVQKDVTSFVVRKSDWRNLMKNPEFEAMTYKMKQNIEKNYFQNIRNKMVTR